MHYSDGTDAKLGDVVHVPSHPDYAGSEYIGVLMSVTGTISDCNAMLDVVVQRQRSSHGLSQWFKPSAGFPTFITIGKAHKLL